MRRIKKAATHASRDSYKFHVPLALSSRITPTLNLPLLPALLAICRAV